MVPPDTGLPFSTLQSSGVPLASQGLGCGAFFRTVSSSPVKVGLGQLASVLGSTVLALPGMCVLCRMPPRTRLRGIGEYPSSSALPWPAQSTYEMKRLSALPFSSLKRGGGGSAASLRGTIR